jgi:hypothetical protein
MQARAIIADDPRAVPLILSGAMLLDRAYQEVRQRRAYAANLRRCREILDKHAPSIADLVIAEEITLLEGMALYRKRQRQHKAKWSSPSTPTRGCGISARRRRPLRRSRSAAWPIPTR